MRIIISEQYLHSSSKIVYSIHQFYHISMITSSGSAPREERGLLLKSLGKCVAEVSELSDVPMWPLDLSTKTLGICTSCSGLLPSFRAWDRFRICPRSTDICFSNMERS